MICIVIPNKEIFFSNVGKSRPSIVFLAIRPIWITQGIFNSCAILIDAFVIQSETITAGFSKMANFFSCSSHYLS